MYCASGRYLYKFQYFIANFLNYCCPESTSKMTYLFRWFFLKLSVWQYVCCVTYCSTVCTAQKCMEGSLRGTVSSLQMHLSVQLSIFCILCVVQMKANKENGRSACVCNSKKEDLLHHDCVIQDHVSSCGLYLEGPW